MKNRRLSAFFGTIVCGLSGGQTLNVPAETLLEFKLQYHLIIGMP